MLGCNASISNGLQDLVWHLDLLDKSMAENVLSAQDLGKTYRVFARPWDRLREILTGRPRHQAFHALQGVSFDLDAGESLGIIGENGAGKSTLLKILAGVTQPTTGDLRVTGKVSSLLELGMGFHPEFTGRQNIRLNAAMMGLSQEEVEDKLPLMIAFSELGAFIDRPVKTYSTGMAMRLGFSIAIQVDPDILVIDEALSVGDGYFQKKCMDHLLEFLASGRTLIFCSHAMYYVSSFCQRAVWLQGGQVAASGPVDEVVRAYEAFLAAKAHDRELETEMDLPERVEDEQIGPARWRKVSFPGHEEGQPHFRVHEPWELEVAWEVDRVDLGTHVGVGINAADGTEICAFSTHHDGLPPFSGRHEHRVRLRISDLPLIKGEFTLYLFLLGEKGLHVYDQLIMPAAFSVAAERYHFGLVHVDHAWQALPAVEAPAPRAAVSR